MVPSAEKCQEYCKNTVGCAKYSYHKANAMLGQSKVNNFGQRMFCLLFPDKPMNLIAESGTVSGPKICPGSSVFYSNALVKLF